MKVTYLGKRQVSVTDRNTGELIEGTSIFYAYSGENIVGQASGKFFIKSGSTLRMPESITPGKTFNIEFNQYGKVCDISA